MLCTHPDRFNSAAPPDLFRYQITDGKFTTVRIINVPVVTTTPVYTVSRLYYASLHRESPVLQQFTQRVACTTTVYTESRLYYASLHSESPVLRQFTQ